MLKNIFIIRHAKSSWENFELINDENRPLNKRGIFASIKMGRKIKGKFILNKVLSSSAMRALHTSNIMVREMGLPAEIIEIDANLYHASPETILKTLKKVDNSFSNVALFAHNPGINDFARKTGFKINNVVTAGVLHYQYKGKWEDLNFKSLEFINYDFPKKNF